MNTYLKTLTVATLLLTTLAQAADDADRTIFLDDELTFVEVTMDPADLQSFIDDPWQDEYVSCSVRIHNSAIDETLHEVGIRVRGNTSRGSIKKSWKLSFNKFVAGRQLHGLEKLNLNGEHNDPTIARARLGWDLLRAMGLPATRARHAHLTINDGALVEGVYLNVEQIDEEFLKDRFGNNDGNMYKCLYKGQKADLGYVAPGDGATYAAMGDGRTYVEGNSDSSDYTDLAEFIDFINHADDESFASELPLRFSINSFLRAMACDVVMGNWDDYWYGANNYYLYHNEDTDRLEYIPYDLDNTYGVDFFGIDWATRSYSGWGNGGYGSSDGQLPVLIRRVLETPVFETQLRRYLREALITYFPLDATEADLDQVKTMLQPHAFQGSFADGNMDWNYDAEGFRESFTQPAFYRNFDGGWDYGLKPFIADHDLYLRQSVTAPPALSPLRLNEFMASNDTTLQDEAGDFDDWVELYNPSSTPIDLSGMFLTDDLTRPMKWAIPDTFIAADGYLLIWCDKDPEDGPLHANFKLSAEGEELALFAPLDLGNGTIDRVSFGPQTADVSEGRVVDGTGAWGPLAEPSPGATNGSAIETPPAVQPAQLQPCFPNPFNARVNIHVSVPVTMTVQLDVFDLRGRRVRSIVDGVLEEGTNELSWDGMNEAGRPVPSGTYLCRMKAGGQVQTRRMVLAK